MSILYVQSAFEAPSETIRLEAMEGRVRIARQIDLTPEILLAHRVMITGNQLDQDVMLAMKDASRRWFFNGDLVRPLVDGLAQNHDGTVRSLQGMHTCRLAPLSTC